MQLIFSSYSKDIFLHLFYILFNKSSNFVNSFSNPLFVDFWVFYVNNYVICEWSHFFPSDLFMLYFIFLSYCTGEDYQFGFEKSEW